MAESIPAPILLADQVHHQILEEISFSKHLNPVNSEAARQAFMRGAASPPFEYAPLYQADDALARLNDVEPDRAHPAGDLVGKSIDHTRLLIRALRDEPHPPFTCYSLTTGIQKRNYSKCGLRTRAPPFLHECERGRVNCSEAALEERGVADWKVIRDQQVMSARVL